MKVSDIIQALTEDYAPDEELVIAWWGPEVFEDLSDGVGREYPREVWRRAAAKTDNTLARYSQAFTEIHDEIENALIQENQTTKGDK